MADVCTGKIGAHLRYRSVALRQERPDEHLLSLNNVLGQHT